MTRIEPLPVFAPLGDGAIMVTLSETASREVTRQVHAAASAVRSGNVPDVLDVVPAYASFAVHYDPISTDAVQLETRLRDIVAASLSSKEPVGANTLVTIPVRYDGPDLDMVARETGLTRDDVIARHHATEYSVYMIGFAPGFAYLGDLDPALHLPRREAPRTRVPPGSVAIAGSQTAVYPLETPGGWHLIGTTTLRMFDALRDPPSLLKAGDRARFERVP